jgi:hypothetical protein
VSDENRAIAIENGCPSDRVDAAWTEFVDYWSDIPGQKGCKLSWTGTWRNRVKFIFQRTGNGNGKATDNPRAGSLIGAIDRRLAALALEEQLLRRVRDSFLVSWWECYRAMAAVDRVRRARAVARRHAAAGVLQRNWRRILAQRGFKVAVLEADRVCSGASGRNGGQVIVGYASGQSEVEQQLGMQAARQMWDMSLEAIDLMDARIAQWAIACERKNGYLYVADSPRKARALDAEMDAMDKTYGLSTVRAHGAGVRSMIDAPRYVACAYEKRSGHVHPLKYGLGLARAALSRSASELYGLLVGTTIIIGFSTTMAIGAKSRTGS